MSLTEPVVEHPDRSGSDRSDPSSKGYLPYDLRRRAANAAKPKVAPSLPKSDYGPSAFNPMDMYAPRNNDPHRPYSPGPEPGFNPSLSGSNNNPQARITAMEQPNPGRITGAMYDFLRPPMAAADNSELFNMDVSGQAAQKRFGGEG